MYCPKCGREAEAGARFCVRCGTPFPVAPLPQKPSRAKTVLFACLRAAAYFLFFVVMQNIVAVGYIFLHIFRFVMQGAMGGLDPATLYDRAYSTAVEALTQHLHMLLILSTLLSILILCVQFRLRHKNPLAEMHVRSVPLSRLGAALLFGASLQILVSLLLSVLPIPESLVESFNENAELLYGGPIVWEFIDVALFTPIIEEITFRGLIFTRLRRGMAAGVAVAVSAVVFGIAHGHIISFVYAGALGALLAVMMLKNNDSILVTICCHAGFNAASYLLQLITSDSIPLFAAIGLAAAAAACFGGYVVLRPLPAPAAQAAGDPPSDELPGGEQQ